MSATADGHSAGLSADLAARSGERSLVLTELAPQTSGTGLAAELGVTVVDEQVDVVGMGVEHRSGPS